VIRSIRELSEGRKKKKREREREKEKEGGR
jgi:hypothetical protein